MITRILSSTSFWTVNKHITKYLGCANASLLLAELISKYDYFENRSELLERDGKVWFYATADQIEDVLGLARRAQESAIELLCKVGFIEKRVFGTPAKRYFAVNEQTIMDVMNKQESPKRTNKNVQNVQTGLDKKDKLYIITEEKNKKNNNNNDDFDFPKPSKKQGELVTDEQDFFTGFEQEINTPPVQVVKPPKPIVTAKTTNVLRLNEIWGKDYAEQVVWLQKAGEEVAVWLQSGAEGLCQPNSFEGMDLAEMFVYWVGKETGRIFQSKNPDQWKTSICNYARVQKANGGFKSVTKSAPYPNAEANEAPKGFTPAKSRLSGKAFLDYVDKVKAAKAAGIITHAQAMEYINFHKQD